MAIDNPPVAPSKPVKGSKNDDEIALENNGRMKAYFDSQPKVTDQDP